MDKRSHFISAVDLITISLSQSMDQTISHGFANSEEKEVIAS